MGEAKKKVRKTRAIVVGHLEKVSSVIFGRYQKQITDMIRGHYGVYALYKRNSLYYIGLATDLKRRIRQHLRDRHKKNWTHFSLYIFKKEGHIKELESLLVRIADPAGNRITGRLKGSRDLKPHLKQQIRTEQQKEIEDLLTHRRAGRKKVRKKAGKRSWGTDGVPLKGVLKNGQGLYATYKGKSYRATYYARSGIKLNGKMYPTLSGAAKRIVDRGTVNGWSFWKCKDGDGNLVAVKALRK